jgi:hypothetical protein
MIKAVGMITSAALFVGLVGFSIWMHVGIWNECRETNSFWYCVKVVGR